MADTDKIHLGRLWKGTSKDNKPYLSGVVTHATDLERAVDLLRAGGRFLILGNDRKREGKRDPDCELYVVPGKRE
jgi:hypothetical protein